MDMQHLGMSILVAEDGRKDVSALAGAAGFTYPVKVSPALWADSVAWASENAAEALTRLRGLLTIAGIYAGHIKGRSRLFQHLRVLQGETRLSLVEVELYLVGEGASSFILLQLASESPQLHRCARCKSGNRIVNQCGCDPHNLPTALPA